MFLTFRNHSDNTDSTENGLDYEERFEFHSCNGTEVTLYADKNVILSYVEFFFNAKFNTQ